MDAFISSVLYVLTFLSLYVQVFFFVTFLENRKKIVRRIGSTELSRFPSVTIIVPCYNEEVAMEPTIQSLLDLKYPKDKMNIIIVDDGSTDNSWNVIQQYKDHPQIKIYHKENGGKHTAMNFALEKTTTELVGGLDSDSFVDPHALERIVTYFIDDPKTMAVAPSIIVHQPSGILQKAQKAEYDMAIYNKKMLAFLGAIHVTPGPFSIFRKKVFDDLGPYRKAHNTEDQEIALRMQEHGYKIEHCPDAYVYTISPDSVPKLYRQRIRWIYGFIKNALDYRRLIFKREYGHLAFFTIPSGVISIVSVVFLFWFFIYSTTTFIIKKVTQFSSGGFSPSFDFNFDWFFFNTESVFFISIILYGLVITALLLGRRMSEGKGRFSLSVFYFIIVYSVIAPFWLLKALWNAIWSRESSWIAERTSTTK